MGLANSHCKINAGQVINAQWATGSNPVEYKGYEYRVIAVQGLKRVQVGKQKEALQERGARMLAKAQCLAWKTKMCTQ